MTHHLPLPPRYNRLWMTLVVLALVCVVGIGDARAQSPSSADMQRFERHVSQAAQAMDAGDYERAVEELTMAADIVDHPRIQLRLGDAYVALNRCDAARSVFDAIEGRDDFDDALQERLAARRAQLDDCTSTGKLLLHCTPPEMTVTIDGASQTCSKWLELEADIYGGTARHEGYQSTSFRIEIEAGQRVEKELELVPELDEGRPTQAYIGMGGVGAGIAFVATGALMETRASGRAERMIEARNAGEDERVQQLRSDADRARKMIFSAYGLGAAALITGSVLWWRSGSDDRDARHTSRLEIGVDHRRLSLRLRW